MAGTQVDDAVSSAEEGGSETQVASSTLQEMIATRRTQHEFPVIRPDELTHADDGAFAGEQLAFLRESEQGDVQVYLEEQYTDDRLWFGMARCAEHTFVCGRHSHPNSDARCFHARYCFWPSVHARAGAVPGPFASFYVHLSLYRQRANLLANSCCLTRRCSRESSPMRDSGAMPLPDSYALAYIKGPTPRHAC